MTEIGFIGLGNIGLQASINLIKAGFTVSGYDIRASQDFVEAGGRQVETIADLAHCPVIVQSLPSITALETTVSALLGVVEAGQAVVDLSSYALEAKQAQASRLGDRGVEMLDCEISGLPHQVATRSAVIFKAGDEATVGRLKPVFDAIAEKHFYLGAFGAATKMKLVANTMVCVHDLMAAEALNLGARIGLDPAQMIQVLGPSAAGSATFANKAPLMVERRFVEGRGPFRHMFGYLARASAMAQAAGATTPLLETTRKFFALAEAEGRHDEDIAAIIEVIEQQQQEKTA